MTRWQRAMAGRVLPVATGITVLLVCLATGEILLRWDILNRHILPLPSDVLLALVRIVVEEGVPSRFAQTLGEAMAAFLLTAVTGIAVGTALYRLDLLREATQSWVAAAAAAPIVLAYPLFLVIFGRNALAIVMLAFVAGLAPVILKTLEGLRAVRPVLLDVGRSFKLEGAQLFWRVLFPAAVPTIFTGLRLGLIFALINVVGVEFMTNFGGLGQLINDLADRYDIAGTYAAILVVILVSVVIFALVERVELWFRPIR